MTLAFTGLVVAVGGCIVASIVLVMTFLPDYRITSTSPLAEREQPTADATTSALPSFEAATRSNENVGVPGDLRLIAVNGPQDILHLLLTTSLIVFGVVLVVGVFACWRVAGRVLRPVEQITAAARRAADGSLDHRIGHSGPNDEFGRLAATFDDMLERLDRSFDARKRFAANASHELRTPLATSQAILDVALLDPSAVDVETLTAKLRETNTRNIETIEALLALSDAEAGTASRDRVALEDTVREVVASRSAAAADADLTMTARIDGITTSGDATLLRLLVDNLVGNAIRYNHRGGKIDVTLADSTLTVENSGARVDETDLSHLTEPFFRTAGRVSGSHGLGLAIVEAIARSHGAELVLDAPTTGGLRAVVRFA